MDSPTWTFFRFIILHDFVMFYSRESTSDFKWQGWLNGGKNQKPKTIPWASNKPQKIPGPKCNPQKSNAEFPSHKNFQKVLKYNDITWKIETLVLNTIKNTCQNFLTPKNPEIENFEPKRILRSGGGGPAFDHTCHFKSRIPHSGCPTTQCNSRVSEEMAPGFVLVFEQKI